MQSQVHSPGRDLSWRALLVAAYTVGLFAFLWLYVWLAVRPETVFQLDVPGQT